MVGKPPPYKKEGTLCGYYDPTVTAQVCVYFLPPTVISAVILQFPAPAAETTPPETVATEAFEVFQVTVASAGVVVAVIV